MNAPLRQALRRGWCPSTLKPMETGDGWLVRLHPPRGLLTPAQLARIAALAREHGNGLIEISARGNLQIRGVRLDTHPALVEALLSERLVDEHDGDGPQKLTLVSPLFSPAAGGETGTAVASASDKIDAAVLAGEIEALARTIPGLPPKLLVVIDDGGPVSLDEFACDLRLVAVASNCVAIGLPDGSWLGPVAAQQAGDTVAAILRRFAEWHRQAPIAIRRLRDLPSDTLATLCDLPDTSAPVSRLAPRRVGLFFGAKHTTAALIALPFGRCDAHVLAALAHSAEAFGAASLRLSPWRGIAFHGLSGGHAEALLDSAKGLGLIVHDDDPRLSVQACAGKPACLRAETDAMADAGRLTAAAALLLDRGVSLHVSGCVKSCAHSGAADLTLVGREGRYGVVVGGSTRDPALAELDLSEILRRLQPGQDLFARLTAAAPAGPRA